VLLFLHTPCFARVDGWSYTIVGASGRCVDATDSVGGVIRVYYYDSQCAQRDAFYEKGARHELEYRTDVSNHRQHRTPAPNASIFKNRKMVLLLYKHSIFAHAVLHLRQSVFARVGVWS
jgi:hypothetical protein